MTPSFCAQDGDLHKIRGLGFRHSAYSQPEPALWRLQIVRYLGDIESFQNHCLVLQRDTCSPFNLCLLIFACSN